MKAGFNTILSCKFRQQWSRKEGADVSHLYADYLPSFFVSRGQSVTFHSHNKPCASSQEFPVARWRAGCQGSPGKPVTVKKRFGSLWKWLRKCARTSFNYPFLVSGRCHQELSLRRLLRYAQQFRVLKFCRFLTLFLFVALKGFAGRIYTSILKYTQLFQP